MLDSLRMEKCRDLAKCSLKMGIGIKEISEAICLGEKEGCFRKMGKYAQADGKEGSMWDKCDYV